MRPGWADVTTTSLTATWSPSASDAARVQSPTIRNSPAKTRGSASSRRSPSALVRKPMRPKLTPKTGVAVSSVERSARSIVPSPPSATTRSGLPSPSCVSSTPASFASRATRPSASPIRSGSPWVKTAADVMPSPTLGGVDQVEEELTVSLRAGQTGVGHSLDPRAPFVRAGGDFVDHAPVHLGVADDSSFADFGPAGLELRLDEDESAPARRRTGKSGRQRLRQ